MEIWRLVNFNEDIACLDVRFQRADYGFLAIWSCRNLIQFGFDFTDRLP